MTVGFVEVAAMGRATAERLAKPGNSLPCHRIKVVSEGLFEVGARPTASPAEVAGGVELTTLVLRDTPDVVGGADEPSGPALALKLCRDLKIAMDATPARALGERDRSGGCHGR